MKRELNLAFEKGVRLLAVHMPAGEKMRKPTLFHGLRVGSYLYNRDYPREVVLAGLLHDALEFTDISKDTIQKEFGDEVLKLIVANTKDDSISDPLVKTEELIKRCVENGEDALIVKTVDILDSFQYYTDTKNYVELEYCQRNMRAILEYKRKDFTDPIFDELNRCSRE